MILSRNRKKPGVANSGNRMNHVSIHAFHKLNQVKRNVKQSHKNTHEGPWGGRVGKITRVTKQRRVNRKDVTQPVLHSGEKEGRARPTHLTHYPSHKHTHFSQLVTCCMTTGADLPLRFIHITHSVNRPPQSKTRRKRYF